MTIPGVTRVPILFVNAYLVASGEDFVLVDTGVRGAGTAAILRAIARRYGRHARPTAIILTHGHFDHAGSAHTLARRWDVPVYAHRLELPYLTGRSSYPPQDPTVGGTLANLSRAFPRAAIDLGTDVHPLAEGGEIPDLAGWCAMHTPGHTPGHISLFREDDGALIAGDAIATMDQESPVELFVRRRQLRWPPATMTPDWQSARRTVEALARLRPDAVAAGHGLPITGSGVADALEQFARTFTPPPHGRYVHQAARADERGTLELPPPVPDPVGRVLKGVAAAVAVASVVRAARRRRRRRRDRHAA